jgi:predicted phosphoribosyltransferase
MKLNAIQSLWNKDCHQDDKGNIFIAGKPPTASENSAIDAEVLRLEAAQKANQYKQARKYPSVPDQLDMIYWDGVNGTTNFQAAIGAVKAASPKGVV